MLWTRTALSVLLAGMVLEATLGAACFVRGDADANGVLNLTDALLVFRALFEGGKGGDLGCADAADADDSGRLNVTDGVLLLRFLFTGGRPPPAPRLACGIDLTDDTLDCRDYPACAADLADLVADTDAVVFVIDRSGAMQDSGELARAKLEVEALICAFKDDGEVGGIFFDRGVLRHPPSGPLLESSDANKRDLTWFVRSVAGGVGTCVLPALLEALKMLGESVGARKTIVLLSDGLAGCGGEDWEEHKRRTLEAVRSENTGGIIIHAVAVLHSDLAGEEFLGELAAQNGGRLVKITW